MKKCKTLLFVIIIVLAIGGSSYFYLNHNGKMKEDTTISDAIVSKEPSDNDEVTASLTPKITVTPILTQTSEGETRLSTNRYAATQLIDGKKKYGYITEKGEFMIAPQYSYASDFNNGVAIVSKDEKFYIINTDRKILFTNDSIISEFKNGVASFGRQIGDSFLYGYVDDSGKIIIEPQYMFPYDFNQEQQAYVKLRNKKYALINLKGEIIETYDLESKYSNIYQIADGYVIYTDGSDGKYGVDLISSEVIYEPLYSHIEYLGHDLFAMKEPKLEFFEISNLSPSALFNNQGEQITGYELYDITHFDGKYASVTDSISTYFIGVDGKVITTLPKLNGRGTLIMLGDVIKADIDEDIYYCRKDGEVIYKAKNEFDLGSGIIVKEEKFKPNKFVLIRYPYIEGLKNTQVQEKVNQQLKLLFTQYRLDLKEEDGLTVSDKFMPNRKNDLIIISMSGYDYSFGAAHGMPLKEYYYIDINSGKFYQLSDLFKVDSDYQLKINEIISEQINKKIEKGESYLFSDAFTGIEANHDFILTDNSIIIYFYPYDIAPYAEGFPEFEISFSGIMDLIDTDSEFYKVFN
jgi:uncharacterized protein YxeA